MRNRLHTLMLSAAVLGVAGLSLAACDPAPETDTTGSEIASTRSDRTLTAALSDQGDAAGFRDVLDNSGLSTALEGVGPYTVFAPSDTALGTDADGLKDEAMSAEAAALVRAHIVPGSLGRVDINAAIDASGNDQAQMRTMGDDMLTFTRDGETIVVTASDGASARLAGTEVQARNGVIQPIDAVLVKTEAAE